LVALFLLPSLNAGKQVDPVLVADMKNLNAFKPNQFQEFLEMVMNLLKSTSSDFMELLGAFSVKHKVNTSALKVCPPPPPGGLFLSQYGKLVCGSVLNIPPRRLLRLLLLLLPPPPFFFF
jgi:hypothetical protein